MKYIVLVLLLVSAVWSQEFVPNYDESKIPAFELPDVLLCQDGTRVQTVADWQNKRRPEILELFKEYVYGHAPEKFRPIRFKLTDVDTQAFNGLATRKQITVYLTGKKSGPSMEILMYLPNAVAKPVAIFSTYNFGGNHTICDDPAIHITQSWVANSEAKDITDNRATAASRGAAASRWPVEYILQQGFGLATIYYGDVDPDKNDFSDGIHAAFYQKGQTHPAANAWGSIAAWAWGQSRAMDYYQRDQDVDAGKVIVMGHSRLGKTSVWAGAADERFALIISNDSGCGGAALSRREFGETVGRINNAFPHWFCDNFKQYNKRVNDLPVDQHMLIALCAPRPIYIASAEDDRWADPHGEFLAGVYASPVYELFSLTGLPQTEMPPVNTPIMGNIAYHIRTGKHDVKDYDWQQYCAFAKHFLK